MSPRQYNMLSVRSTFRQAAKDKKKPFAHLQGEDVERGLGSASDARRWPFGKQDNKKKDVEPLKTHEEEKTGSGNSAETQHSTSVQSDATASGSGDGLFRRPTAKDSPEAPAEGSAAQATGDEQLAMKKTRTRIYRHVEPSEPFTVGNQIRRTILRSWLNLLLLAAPAGIVIGAMGLNGRIVFAVNFIAIIPLAAMLSNATEEVALRMGEAIGGLINATFGNAVELIVGILALVKGEIAIVQTSLIGSILSNLLLVLGMCFFAGGYRRREQNFNATVVNTASSLLILSISGLIVPTVFDANPQFENQSWNAALSRGVSVVLLLVYIAFLVFQLHTHSQAFSEKSAKVEPEEIWRRKKHDNSQDQSSTNEPQEDEEPDPELHFWVAMMVLAGSTVIIAFCAEYMVDGISAITADGSISEEFVGLILLPIVGNAAEHVTAVTVAYKDKMDLSIGVAIGSSIQISLLVIPLMIIVGWGLQNDAMTLAFDTFQVAVMFVSVLLVNYLISDGKSNWLEGVMLIALYICIAVCSWWYPANT